MAAHRAPRVRSSTVIIAVMYVTCVAYVALQIWFYDRYMTFLPVELTGFFAAVFVAETVSLARLRMAKEQGRPMPAKASNPYLSQIGADVPDFEDEVQKELDSQGGETK